MDVLFYTHQTVYVHGKGGFCMIYENEYLNEISFPLGGIGSGCIGLAGNGRLIEWEICNRPNKYTHNPYSFFAIRAEYPSGKVVCKVLQGDLNKDFTGALAGNGHGANKENMWNDKRIIRNRIK